MIAGEKAARTPRFVKTAGGDKILDAASLERARRLVGLKGYVTNIPANVMPAGEVISSYHDLWQVEASFRMSKTDLRARPIFHRQRDAIEAHLTVVFAALAVARHLQNATGLSIRRIVRTTTVTRGPDQYRWTDHHRPHRDPTRHPDHARQTDPLNLCKSGLCLGAIVVVASADS